MLAGGGGFFRYGVVRESTINRLPGPQICRNYTATATLWKVDMTVSNVWTRRRSINYVRQGLQHFWVGVGVVIVCVVLVLPQTD